MNLESSMRLACFAVLALALAPLGMAETAPPWGNPAIQAGPTPVTDPTAVPKAAGWRAETIVSGLAHPWGLAFLPNGDMLVTERPGRLRLVRDGKLDPAPISGTPEVLALRQGGLLDVSVHPDFARNRLIYLTFSSGTEEANGTRLVRGELRRGKCPPSAPVRHS
jgi:glucose/arabinose dehydrogenase